MKSTYIAVRLCDGIIDKFIDVLKIVSLGNSQFKANFKEKFFDQIRLGNEITDLVRESFEAIDDSFTATEIDLLVELLLNRSSVQPNERSLVWNSIGKSSTSVFVKAVKECIYSDDSSIVISKLFHERMLSDALNLSMRFSGDDLKHLMTSDSKDRFKVLSCLASYIDHAIWLAEHVEIKKLDNMLKMEILKGLVQFAFDGEKMVWREDTPKSLMKATKKMIISCSDEISTTFFPRLMGDAKFEENDIFLLAFFFEQNESGLDNLIATIENTLRTPLKEINSSLENLDVSFNTMSWIRNPEFFKACLGLSLWVLCCYYQSRKRLEPTTSEEIHFHQVSISLSKKFIAKVNAGENNLVKKLSSKLIDDILLACLKYRLTDCHALELLETLISKGKLKRKPSVILEMITTHSKFDSLMVASPKSEKNTTTFHSSRKRIVKLILVLVKMCPESYFSDELAQKLALKYYGTCDESDRVILSIFSIFESNNHPICAYLHLWSNQSDGASGPLSETFSVIETNLLSNSVASFPVNLDMDLESSLSYPDTVSSHYDARFMLNLTATALNNSSVDIYRLIEKNAIGLAFKAMSSDILETRKIGHYIIARVYELLQEKYSRERDQIVLLLESLRHSIVSTKEDPFPIIPTIISEFLARGIVILTKPDSDMYLLYNRFFLQRAAIDLADVPMFYDMFYSSTEDCKKERKWMLKLISDSLKSQQVKSQ